MTIFTIRLQTDSDIPRWMIYSTYGRIAENIAGLSDTLTLLDIADAPNDGSAPAASTIPAKTRKPRGKNKPKVQQVSSGDVPGTVSTASIQSNMDIPASLKRTAE